MGNEIPTKAAARFAKDALRSTPGWTRKESYAQLAAQMREREVGASGQPQPDADIEPGMFRSSAGVVVDLASNKDTRMSRGQCVVPRKNLSTAIIEPSCRMGYPDLPHHRRRRGRAIAERVKV